MMEFRSGVVVFCDELAKELSKMTDEFIIFVEDGCGNELYTVEAVTEAPSHQVMILGDLDEYEVGGRKRVEITVVDLDLEDECEEGRS